MSVSVSAFYKFVAIEDCAALQVRLRAACEAHGIRGSVLIAPEGLNATISGPDERLREFLAWLRGDTRFVDLVSKESLSDAHPFGRLKVRLKREIVTFGVSEADPSHRAGAYVAPKDWNTLITAPDIAVIDTRNAYEVAIGTFQGALNPNTKAFGEFPAYVKANLDPAQHKRVAMFCTGGIRCEKASAYLLNLGFPEVYHLEGGILKYLETVPASESLWRGECFVFDERVAVRHGVEAGTHVMCAVCGRPVPRDDRFGLATRGQQRCMTCESRSDPNRR